MNKIFSIFATLFKRKDYINTVLSNSTKDGDILIYEFGSPSARNRFLITAGKHGGEIEGVHVIEKLLKQIFAIKYKDCFFVIIPNMNPDGIKSAANEFMNIKNLSEKLAIRDKYRLNKQDIDLNRDYPFTVCHDENPDIYKETVENIKRVNPGSEINASCVNWQPVTAQTKIIMALHDKYNFNCMLDFHSHRYTRYSSYICNNPASASIAQKLNDINGCRWAYKCYDDKELYGTPGNYYKETGIHFITIELGVIPTDTLKTEQHMERITDEQLIAMDWLFNQKISQFK